jgi:hypothetical protein
MNDDFGKTVKDKYDAIEKKEAETRQKLEALADEKAPLKAFLTKAGVLTAKTRNRKPKTASTISG